MLTRGDTLARQQHKMVRESAGWFHWPHDILEVEGAEALGYLEHCFMAVMGKTPVGGTKYTPLLNALGLVADDTIAMHMAENRWWLTTPSAGQLLPLLEEAGAGFDCTCRVLQPTMDIYTVQGPRALEAMNALLEQPVDELKRFRFQPNDLRGHEVLIHRSGFTGENGYELYCPMAETGAVREILHRVLTAMDIPEITCREVCLRSLSMEKGLTLVEDMQELTPYECGLAWAVPTAKDFFGASALAARGQEIKTLLTGLEFATEPPMDAVGQTLYTADGKAVGQIRAATYGYTVEKYIGYAAVAVPCAQPGQELFWGAERHGVTLCAKGWL